MEGGSLGHEQGTYAAMQRHRYSSWPGLIARMETIPSTF
jgi:hypothetical protein